MLRDERQIALNGAIEASLNAAHVHEEGAELIGENGTDLRRLAALRRRHAQILAAHLRQLGDLPKEPDPEYQVAADLLSHIKAALAENERAQAMARSQEAEDHFAAALQEALQQNLPPDCRDDVERILASRAQLA
jgi:uncharacterized protein (TIGR02284 family)